MLGMEKVIEYCREDISLIENYDKAIADTTETWECHHRLEIQEGKTYSMKELKALRLYYMRPACELIFLTKSDHSRLHAKNRSFGVENKGKKHSEETKEKIRQKAIGRKHSEEHKRKISEAHKGKRLSEEHKRKLSEAQKLSEAHRGKRFSEEHKQKMSLAHKGKPAWNKGKHLSEETKRKMSETRKGKPSPKKGKTYKQKENK